LGEIEAALQEHSGVKQAAVIAREEDGGEKRLVAYVVPASTELKNQELKDHLRERLPEYMVPAAYVHLEELPLTVNGKLERKRLPSPATGIEARGAVVPAFTGPRDLEEEILCGIWQHVLKLERVGVEDNFFELGGHSLLATQVISRVRTVFGLELAIRALFEAPTVAGLAEWVKRARGTSQVMAPPLVRVVRKGDRPLSYAQQRLWFLDQLAPESTAYNIPFALRLRGELNREALGKSFQELVRRHEALRTTFAMRDGSPVQVIANEFEMKIEDVDLLGLKEEQREAEARRVAQEEVESAFDLGSGPLLRVKLVRVGEQEHVLVVNMHHIVSDGWSAGIMIREFRCLYEGYVRGEAPSLPELKIQYGDYAEWQREWLQGEVLEGQIEYWRKQLEGVRELELGTDRARPAVMSQRGAMYSFTVAEDMLRKVEELSQREGVTLYMTLLAALQVVLWRYSGQEDIAVGTPVAGRKRTETEGLIGFFINTLVLRTRMRGEWSFRELLGEVRERTLEAYEHQDVPFEKLVDELEVERDMSRTPLFQVAMVLQNAGQEELQLGGLEVEEYSLAEENRTAKFDLTWGLWESGRGLQGGVEYNTDLYERETVARMVERWQGVLEQGVENAEKRLREISLWGTGEGGWVLGWGVYGGRGERGRNGERRKLCAVGGAEGGGGAGEDSGGGRRGAADVWRDEPAGRAVGALSEEARGEGGDASGGVSGRCRSLGGGDPGSDEGGRSSGRTVRGRIAGAAGEDGGEFADRAGDNGGAAGGIVWGWGAVAVAGGGAEEGGTGERRGRWGKGRWERRRRRRRRRRRGSGVRAVSGMWRRGAGWGDGGAAGSGGQWGAGRKE
jgi:hypothetical protein